MIHTIALQNICTNICIYIFSRYTSILFTFTPMVTFPVGVAQIPA